jgi:deoxyadenosine/deoxycytidine kinase
MRIEVCGGIATGKTSLAEHLAKHEGYKLIKETYRGVPFWEKFYQAPSRYSLEKNFSFLLAHADAIPDSSEMPSEGVICDFAMFQDLAYANLGPEGELPAIIQLYDRITTRMVPPALVVYLKCATHTQLKRIALRGRGVESTIDERYLENLNSKIESGLTFLRRNSNVKIFEIDTDQVDFRLNNLECEKLRSRLSALVTGGRTGF